MEQKKSKNKTFPFSSCSMRNTPGIMSQMPPLPVLLNEELVCSIFPHSSQVRPALSPHEYHQWLYVTHTRVLLSKMHAAIL